MVLSSIFSLTPTFTQGLIIGQVSVLVLVALVLKYLFLDTSDAPGKPHPPTLPAPLESRTRQASASNGAPVSSPSQFSETAEWFNVILQHVAQAYRQELRDNLTGFAGDECARVKLERWINDHRGASLIDTIQVHSVDIGTAAPRFLSARVLPKDKTPEKSEIECAISYEDSVSLSLSTSLLLHYPTPAFARLPVSLTLSLDIFTAKITITPPCPTDPAPCLTVKLDPSFTLDLKTSSLLGSRAKLSDVPKVHDLITERIRSSLAARGVWKVLLPGVRAKDVVDMLEKKR